MTVNYIVKEKSSSLVKPMLIILLYVVLYFILFEFLVPVNDFLPRPTILSDTLISLQEHYHLGLNLLFTVSTIYLSILLGYLLLSFCAGFVLRFGFKDNPFISSLRLFKYFPIPLVAAVFVLWIKNNVTSELLFSLLMSFLYFAIRLLKLTDNVKDEYTDSVSPLKVKDNVIYKEIIWKSLEPAVLRSFSEINFTLWTIILLFEYIKGSIGIGYIIRMSVEYNDLSGIFVISIISGVIVFLGDRLMSILKKKLIRWES